MKKKCKHCVEGCPLCIDDICYFEGEDFYEPDDYEEGDIGSATIAEMRRQNGDY